MKTKRHPLSRFAVRRSLTTLVVVGAVICGGSSLAAPADSPTNLSLARTYPLAALSEILVSRDLWRPFPTIEDRERWQALPEAVQTYLVARGEEALKTPWPGLPATLYLGYAREGTRARFDAVYFERRALLQQLVLAECVEAGEILAAKSASAALLVEVWLASDDMQLMAARSHAGLLEGLYVAAWGAHLNRLVMQDRSPVLKDLWSLRLTQVPSAEQP